MIKHNHKDNFFHSFFVRPAIKFENQSATEEILLMVRAHPLTQILCLFNCLVVMIFLLLIDYFFGFYFTFNQLFFFNLLVITILFNYLWFNFLAWYFNLGIITNERIIDVDFSSVLYKEVTTAYYQKIEDVTVKTGGFFASIVDYGNIFIQTAGTEANIEFMNIPKPGLVAETINDLIKKK